MAALNALCGACIERVQPSESLPEPDVDVNVDMYDLLGGRRARLIEHARIQRMASKSAHAIAGLAHVVWTISGYDWTHCQG